jgi:hypothetical protein
MKKPMKNQILIGSTLLMLASMPVFGADTMEMSRGTRNDTGEFYQANELSMDLFGTGSVGKYTLDHLSSNRVRHDSELGAGVGLTYFMTRTLGIGVEAYAEDADGVFIDSASANLTLRFPLGESAFAPYVFGGGGNQFDLNDVWFGQAGGGFEFRFTHNVGVFADARIVWPNETQYYGVARVGMRFTF